MTSPTEEETRKTFNLYNYQSQLNKAFLLDCDEIFQQFERAQTNEFAAFSQIWRENRFSDIFHVETKSGDLEKFLENCFTSLKRFLDVPDGRRKLCAFFLLYAIFAKQPIRQFVRIRATSDDFRKIRAIAQTNGETRFLFKQLLKAQAFDFVAVNVRMELHRDFVKHYQCDLEAAGDVIGSVELLDRFREFPANLQLAELQTIESDYQSLLGNYENLATFQTDLAGNLKKILQPISPQTVDTVSEQTDEKKGKKLKTSKSERKPVRKRAGKKKTACDGAMGK